MKTSPVTIFRNIIPLILLLGDTQQLYRSFCGSEPYLLLAGPAPIHFRYFRDLLVVNYDRAADIAMGLVDLQLHLLLRHLLGRPDTETGDWVLDVDFLASNALYHVHDAQLPEDCTDGVEIAL